jgi:hypothetical protein
MADHRATWVRLREVARQRFPDDDQAAENATRALFDVEEAAAYAAELDAQEGEQGVLDTVRVATRLRGELREELRAEGFGTGGNEDEYVHLDDDDDLDYDLDTDDLDNLELHSDTEAAESTSEQRALMASFETHRCDESGRRLMAVERRAAAADLAASQHSARHLAYRRNIAAARKARDAAKRCQEEERARAAALARARENQYSLPSYYANAGILEDAQCRRQQWREERNGRRLEAGNHGGSAPVEATPAPSSIGSKSRNSSGLYSA